MQFAEVIGKQKSKTELLNLARSQKVPHALMLVGPTGSGKLALGIALAQYLMCEAPTENDSCGQCNACNKVSKLVHPDLHFSFPTIGRGIKSDEFATEWRTAVLNNPYLGISDWLNQINQGKPNAQGNINKDECLNIIRKLSLKSFESKKKILILWLPEFLQKEGNRLLKIIEEPTDDTHFLLISDNPNEVLNTIISRCQLIKINSLSIEQISDALVEEKIADATQAQFIAPLANGNYNTAIKLANDQQNDFSQLFVDWLRKCYQGNGKLLVEWSEEFAKQSKNHQKNLLLYGIHFSRALLIYKVKAQLNLGLSESQSNTMQNMSKVLQIPQIEKMVKVLNDAHHHIERNANPKILFLKLSIDFKRIFKQMEIAGSNNYLSITMFDAPEKMVAQQAS